MAAFVKVASTADLSPGKVKAVAVNGKTIALCNAGGAFYALDNACPHRGGPLGEGYLQGTELECPWHGWKFSACTGASTVNPSMTVPCYEVKIEGTDVLVAL